VNSLGFTCEKTHCVESSLVFTREVVNHFRHSSFSLNSRVNYYLSDVKWVKATKEVLATLIRLQQNHYFITYLSVYFVHCVLTNYTFVYNSLASIALIFNCFLPRKLTVLSLHLFSHVK
jgi:hypothetical protein